MRLSFVWSVALLAGEVVGQEESGHATAEILRASEGYSPGSAVELGIRLKIEKGWHTYWVNPGEGGMPVSVEWTLPDGWVAGPLLHPVPKRFMTGDLPGFGYEGEVVFPVFLTPGPEASGEVRIKAEVSWLACDDGACVPGDASLTIPLADAVTGPADGAGTIAEAMKMVPQPVEGAELKVESVEGELRFLLKLPDGMDPSESSVFPMTPTVVDAGEQPEFEKIDGVWQATAKPDAYASGAPDELELVLAGGKLEKPLLVSWEAGDDG